MSLLSNRKRFESLLESGKWSEIRDQAVAEIQQYMERRLTEDEYVLFSRGLLCGFTRGYRLGQQEGGPR